MTRRIAMAALVGAIGVSQPLPTQAEGSKTFQIRLSVMPVDDSARFVGQSTITGSGSATATLTGRALTITGTFKGMQSPVTVARLRSGPKWGMRGPAIADLQVGGDTSGTITGVVNLSQAQVAALEKGRVYLQVDAEQAQAGNLWGWLIPAAGLSEDAL